MQRFTGVLFAQKGAYFMHLMIVIFLFALCIILEIKIQSDAAKDNDSANCKWQSDEDEGPHT